MQDRRTRLLLTVALTLAYIITCRAEVHADPLKVFVSIAPQKYFVEKIGGSLVDASAMVEPGANPHTYEPKARQMAALAKTKVYFAIGVSFEEVWLKRITAVNPEILIVHTDRHIKKMPMAADYTHERVHESAKRNTQQEEERLGREPRHLGILDPHFWTSPPLAMLMARNILMGLLEVDPAHGAEYMGGYKNCIRELLELDADLMGMFAGKKGVEFMVFHPSWGYFADAYGLKQIPVEIEGKQPKPAQLQHLIQYARERGIRVIFVQPQLSTKSAETIAQAIGGEVVFADPLAEDWAQNLHDQAAKFKAALK